MKIAPSEFSRVTTREKNHNQFRALFLKNWDLQKRRKGTNCCQLALPLILIIVIGVTNVLLGDFIQDSNGGFTKTPVNSVVRDASANTALLVRPYNYFLYVNEAESPDVGYLDKEGNGSGILGELKPYQTPFTVENGNEKIPYFIEYQSQSELEEKVQSLKETMYSRRLVRGSKIFNTSYSEPTAAIIFKKIDRPSATFEYGAIFEDDADFLSINGPVNTYYTINTIPSLMNYIHNAIAKYLFSNTFTIGTYVQALPYKQLPSSVDLSGFIIGILLPFAVSFLLPVFVYNLVEEKQEKLVQMMIMSGVKMSTYYAVNFVFNFIMYIIVALVVILIGLMFKLPFFLKVSGLITFLMFLGWGLNQICLSFLLSTFFSKSRTATIVCYMLVIASILVSLIVEQIAFNGKDPNAGYYIWPAFAFYHYIKVVGSTCGNDCPNNSDIAPGTAFSKILIVLYLEAFLFLVLAAYFEQILPKEFGVRRSPFFPCQAATSQCRKKVSFPSRKEDSGMEMELGLRTPSSVDLGNEKKEDPDVAQEREKVRQISDPSKYPVVIKKLRKVYKNGQKVAVNDLSLSLGHNECFGLLGPNGAGKTTTISICTGLFGPTEGTAFIGGYDIRTEMDQIHQNIGICPQFDILWDILTAYETVLFYCRVKGVPKDQEARAAMYCLEQVNLQKSRDKLVRELSGGMKRRLSVAVSLVGDPAVIFLDEPTTGLDPDSRRQLWNVLLRVKVGKCISLTTHSMEEADVLCDRIGIMSRGDLKVIGANVRLKNKFGQGYTLKINFDTKDDEQVRKYIKEISPGAEIVEEFPGNITYQISMQNFKMSELLKELLSSKDSIVKDWGLTQTTLEDVFLNIVKTDEEIKDQ